MASESNESQVDYESQEVEIDYDEESTLESEFEDFEVRDYQCHGAIKAPVAV